MSSRRTVPAREPSSGLGRNQTGGPVPRSVETAPAADLSATNFSADVNPTRPPDAVPKPTVQPESPRQQRTSPADPQEDHKSGRWQSWLFWIVLIAAGIGGWQTQARWMPYVAPYLGLSGSKLTKPPPRIPSVGTAKVGQRDVNLHLSALGTVTAFKTVTVRSRLEGELIRVTFTEGQAVQEGDLLAEIDPRPFQAQVEQAVGQMGRDQATLNGVQLTLTRYQQLAKSRIVTAQQLDEQVSLVEQAEAAVKADQAQVDNAKLQLSYCRIVAPMSGRIGLRLVDQGNIVRANEPGGIAVITQLKPIAVLFTIPQDDISRVQRRMRSDQKLVVEAYDRDFSERLAVGELSAIDNQVDSTTGTLRMKAIFPNDDDALFPNQFVNVRLKVETRQKATVVATAAVQRGPSNTFVYVVGPDDKVSIREIEVGPVEGADTVVQNGLQVGETVVTDGLDKLQDGAQVNVKGRGKGKAADKSGGGKAGSPEERNPPPGSTPGGNKRTGPGSGSDPESSPGASPAAGARTAQVTSDGNSSGDPQSKAVTESGKAASDSTTTGKPIGLAVPRHVEPPQVDPPPASQSAAPRAVRTRPGASVPSKVTP